MEIPFVRLILPVAVLYLFYWAFVLNPVVVEPGGKMNMQDSLAPEEARALADQSHTLLARKAYSQALPLIIRLHRTFPENDVYIRELATTYLNLGRFAEEAAMWEEFLQYGTVPADACPEIGLAYQKQRRGVEAGRAFQRCYELEPTADNIMYYAHAVEISGNYEKAGELYREGLKRSPDYPDLNLGLARIELHQGNSNDALQRALAVLGRSPENVDGLLVAGMACARRGETWRAREYFERGIRLAPGYQDLQSAMAGLPGGGRSRSQGL